MQSMKELWGLLLVMLVSFFLADAACAQEKFPSRPIKMVITHAAGGSVDLPGRAMAQYMQKYLKVPVQCENMLGGGGRKAMEYVFGQAKPDGYTIVTSAFPSRLIGELVYQSKYKMKEYVHLGSWVGGDYRTVFVARDSAFTGFGQVFEESKKRKINVGGGGGLGSTSQLQIVYLKELIKLNLNFVPFDSDAEVTAAVLGKHVDIGTGPLSGAIRNHKSGEIRILAVHAPKRIKEIPEVPIMKELGFDGVVIPYGVGAWAPPRTPKERAKILSDAIMAACKDPEFIRWAEKSSTMLEPLGPEEFYKVTLEDYRRIEKVLPLLMKEK